MDFTDQPDLKEENKELGAHSHVSVLLAKDSIKSSISC